VGKNISPSVLHTQHVVVYQLTRQRYAWFRDHLDIGSAVYQAAYGSFEHKTCVSLWGVRASL